ncbi:MAG TPA: DUF6249 domain-containing protein [Patescibacteria group bacterium]|nr:DUF6249 domain-containing protein [Patescibacteria group bacterium]
MQTETTQIQPTPATQQQETQVQPLPATPRQSEQMLTQRQQDELMLKNNPGELLSELQKYRTYTEYRGRDVEVAFLERLTEMVIPMTLFLVTGLVLGKFLQNRHRERMSIIERGLDPIAYKELYGKPKFLKGDDLGMGALKWGLLAVFVGLGIFVGDWLRVLWGYHHGTEFYYPAAMLICGGIGLVIYYQIAARKAKSDKEQFEFRG